MRPRRRPTMRCATACPTWKMLSTLVRITASQSAAASSWKGARCVIPALSTSTSIGPSVDSISATVGRVASRRVTSNVRA